MDPAALVAGAQTELKKDGVSVKQDWLQAFYQHISARKPRISLVDFQRAAFEQFLITDLNIIGSANLPQNVQSMNNQVLCCFLCVELVRLAANFLVAVAYVQFLAPSTFQTLSGQFVLQVDEMVNVAEPYTSRKKFVFLQMLCFI